MIHSSNSMLLSESGTKIEYPNMFWFYGHNMLLPDATVLGRILQHLYYSFTHMISISPRLTI